MVHTVILSRYIRFWKLIQHVKPLADAKGKMRSLLFIGLFMDKLLCLIGVL